MIALMMSMIQPIAIYRFTAGHEFWMNLEGEGGGQNCHDYLKYLHLAKIRLGRTCISCACECSKRSRSKIQDLRWRRGRRRSANSSRTPSPRMSSRGGREGRDLVLKNKKI